MLYEFVLYAPPIAGPKNPYFALAIRLSRSEIILPSTLVSLLTSLSELSSQYLVIMIPSGVEDIEGIDQEPEWDCLLRHVVFLCGHTQRLYVEQHPQHMDHEWEDCPRRRENVAVATRRWCSPQCEERGKDEQASIVRALEEGTFQEQDPSNKTPPSALIAKEELLKIPGEAKKLRALFERLQTAWPEGKFCTVA